MVQENHNLFPPRYRKLHGKHCNYQTIWEMINLDLMWILGLLFGCYVVCRTNYRTDPLSFYIRQNGWIFLDRMVMDKGHAQFKIEATLIAPPQSQSNLYLILLAIPQSEWEEELKLKCRRPSTPQLQREIHLSKSGVTNVQIQFEVAVEKEQTYHLVVKECKNGTKQDRMDTYNRVTLKTVLLSNGDAAGLQSKGLSLYLVVFLLLSILQIRILSKALKQEVESTTLLQIFRVAVWLGAIATLSSLLGHLLFLFQDQQYGVFVVLQILLSSISEELVSIIVVLVGFGWKTLFNGSIEMELYLPVLSMLGVVCVILNSLSRVTDGMSQKYHTYDSVLNYIPIGFKILQVLCFLFGTLKLSFFIDPPQRRKNFRNLMAILFPIGLLYLLSIPLCSIFVSLQQTGFRRNSFTVVYKGLKCIVQFVFIYLFSHPSSRFLKLINNSFMQKGDKIY